MPGNDPVNWHVDLIDIGGLAKVNWAILPHLMAFTSKKGVQSTLKAKSTYATVYGLSSNHCAQDITSSVRRKKRTRKKSPKNISIFLNLIANVCPIPFHGNF